MDTYQICGAYSETSLASIFVDHVASLERLHTIGVVRRIISERSTVQPEVAACLYGLVRGTRLTRTLEIGMGLGLSAISICQAHLDLGGSGQHLAIDPVQTSARETTRGLQHEGFSGQGIDNILEAGVGACFRGVHETESFQALPKLFADGERFEMIFVDGMHTFDYVLLDCFYADLLLIDGGLLVLDDLWLPAVQLVLNFLITNRRFCIQCLEGKWPEHLKLYVVLRKLGGDDRTWDHFADFGVCAGRDRTNIQKPSDFTIVD